MMMNRTNRMLLFRLALISAVVPLAACDSLLEVESPGQIGRAHV